MENELVERKKTGENEEGQEQGQNKHQADEEEVSSIEEDLGRVRNTLGLLLMRREARSVGKEDSMILGMMRRMWFLEMEPEEDQALGSAPSTMNLMMMMMSCFGLLDS